ncbi:MazG nucleotide pyrophosphohydrolase domain-containing protein [Streptomyces niveus]
MAGCGLARSSCSASSGTWAISRSSSWPRRAARPGGGRAALEHELTDCLWSVLILAHRYGVDLDQAFRRTMDELGTSIRAQLPPSAE